ncbi:AraC family transcriptional regulator [Dictyobacter alpinus]|uniref:AraC family transcriptional regulator n=1 Tax=Dictyobacter alpinus TaxID=2014873 RepID=A0A402B665_9CHLR|nr:AraC family transcriptional regulator [Dictyobacter alpinus]GCE26838.1 AraC family transcriptional regulator [Dictyobacter alpinus]
MHASVRLHYKHPVSSQQDLQSCLFSSLAMHPQLPLCARQEFYGQGTDTGLHKHEDFYAFYVVQGGRGVHLINNQPYAITRGNVYVLPPGTTHAYRQYSQLIIHAFYFQPHLFSMTEQAALRALSGFWQLFVLPDEQAATCETRIDHHLHLSPEQHREIEQEINEICREFSTDTLDGTLLTQNQFLRMLIHVARWQGEQGSDNWQSEPAEASDIDLQQKMGLAGVVHFCEEHFHESLTVPQLAAQMFLSPSRFSEIFSQEVGMSPAAYIKQLRLERVQTLLRTSTLTTTKIAHQVGYRDSAQLARVFRSTFHSTPTAYRRSFQAQPE